MNYRQNRLLTLMSAVAVCTLMVGCSTMISHSQSGTEPSVHAKRSLGARLDDNGIVGQIEAKLRHDNELLAAMVQVDSYNKIVLLTGRVPDKKFIDQAVIIASRTPSVRQVHSEITQGAPTTISHYWYDAWLTTKVKSQLTLTSNAPASKTKVRSFAGHVYLMGVMTKQEAKNATYIASRVSGAKKVISMIETINPNEQEAIIAQPPAKTRPKQAQKIEDDTGYIAPTEVDYSPTQSEASNDDPEPTQSQPMQTQELNMPSKGTVSESETANQGLYNEYQQDSQTRAQQAKEAIESYN